jgi:tagaturonate epimerase
MKIEKYSFGTGDRFGKEGTAQLKAIREVNRLGVPVVPVWNKSNREHVIIGSDPADVEKEARTAVADCSYDGNYYIDADHINLDTVDRFIGSSNFFTIDVAHFIGRKPNPEEAKKFMSDFEKYLGKMRIPGIEKDFQVGPVFLSGLADNYLVAANEVSRIYEHICQVKGRDNFVAEVSVDEAELVQGPLELFFILALLKEKGVEVQTIAPKFSGLFAKGIDYIGDVGDFALEFEQDVAAIQYAVKELGLPENLKLSVHSGSDKFSVYPSIRKAIYKFNAGIHVKTAGTTWLEEVIGLSEAGTGGLEMAKEIYRLSLQRYDELTGPYTTVLKINRQRLPATEEVNRWNSRQFSTALTHDPACTGYNADFRQLVHVGYKIAAEMEGFTAALDTNREIIAEKVTHNLLERHLKPIFL